MFKKEAEGKLESMQIDLISHIILSHHGKMEYGSPVVPQFLEAVLVNRGDDMSSYADMLSSYQNKSVIVDGEAFITGSKTFFTPLGIENILSGNDIEDLY